MARNKSLHVGLSKLDERAIKRVKKLLEDKAVTIDEHGISARKPEPMEIVSRATTEEPKPGSETSNSLVVAKQPAVPPPSHGQDAIGHSPLSSTGHSDADDEMITKPGVSRSLRAQDTDKVTAFLVSRLELLQQQIGKRLAKQWIKTICPKKQAKFPYQNSRRRDEENLGPEIPQWWPDTDDCLFKEPDHIPKDSRINLCMHLLRLRVSSNQLRTWNNDHKFDEDRRIDSEGWTEFLDRALGQPRTVFDGLDGGRGDKRQLWDRWLNELFQVAAMEEGYLKGERDGADVFTWTDEPTTQVRARRAPVKKRTRYLSPARNPRRHSDERSLSSDRAAKRARRSIEISHPSLDRQLAMSMSNAALNGPDDRYFGDDIPFRRLVRSYSSDGPSPNTMHDINDDHKPLGEMAMVPYQAAPAPSTAQLVPSVEHYFSAQGLEREAPNMFATTFGAPRPDSACGWTPEQTQFYSSNAFPGKQELTIPKYEQPMNIMVNQVTHVPQPKFESVPSTPIPSFGYRLGGLPSRSTVGQAPSANVGYSLPDQSQMAQQESYPMVGCNGQRRSIAGPPYGYITESVEQASNQWPLVQSGSQYCSPQYQDYKPVVYQQQQMVQYPPQQPQQQQQQHFAQAGMYDVALPQYEDRPYPYPETMPYINPPAAATSGGNERGFTGHGSGVGGGAMT